MDWQWQIDGWIVLVGVLSACSCALLGNYLVLRRLSMMGDAISHAVLPGLAVAFILTGTRTGGAMFAGAVIVGVLTALMTQLITRYGKVEHGASMGVVFSVLFALGLVLIRRAADHVDLDPGCVLYGNIVQVPLDAIGGGIPPAAMNLAIVMAANILFVVFLYKELKISAFDPELSSTVGINSNLMHYLLMVMVAVTTVANFEAVGSILVIAMLIVPPVTAHLLTDRLGRMIGLSLALGAVSAVVGHVLAAFGPRWVGVGGSANTSGMMAVVAGFILLIVLIVSPRYGLLGRALHRRALAIQIAAEDILGVLYRWQELAEASAGVCPRDEVLRAVGMRRARRGVQHLLRRGEVKQEPMEGDAVGLTLTPAGQKRAARLIRAHRLWESYLAEHSELPLDHLHMPAERMEHYLSPELEAELEEEVADRSKDPHGREIP